MKEEKVMRPLEWQWSSFWKNNSWFFAGFFLLLFLGALCLLFIEKGDAILFFSDRRSWWSDHLFRFLTKFGEELAYIIALSVLLFIRYRFAIAIPLIGIVVTIISYYSKAFFAHRRPSLYFQQEGIFEQLNLIDGIILNAGLTSFPSGHTMSAFAFFSFLAFCFHKKKFFPLLFLLFALLVGISRIYLVQHFLQDVYLGAIMGVGVGIMWYYLIFLFPNPHPWLDRSLLKKR